MSQIDMNQTKGQTEDTYMYEETGDYPMNSSFKAVVDINVIPDGWSLDRFIEIANETGYIFVDMSKTTNKPAVKFSNDETMTLENAISILVDRLNEDEDYRMGWVANIAMTFQDEFDDWCKNKVHRDNAPYYIHSISNNAANRFLDNLTYNPSKLDECECNEKRCDIFNDERTIIEITLNKHCYIRELKLWAYTLDGVTVEASHKRIRFVTKDVSDFAAQLDFTEIDDFKIID